MPPLDVQIQIGTVVCLWGNKNDPVFGRVLEMHRGFAWQDGAEDEIIDYIILEDFPTIGEGTSFVWPDDFDNLKIIEGEGWTKNKWAKINGKWVKS